MTYKPWMLPYIQFYAKWFTWDLYLLRLELVLLQLEHRWVRFRNYLMDRKIDRIRKNIVKLREERDRYAKMS